MLDAGIPLVKVVTSAPFQATWDVQFQVVLCPRTGRAGSEHSCGMKLKLDHILRMYHSKDWLQTLDVGSPAVLYLESHTRYRYWSALVPLGKWASSPVMVGIGRWAVFCSPNRGEWW